MLPYSLSQVMIGYAEGQKYTKVGLATYGLATLIHLSSILILVEVYDMGFVGVCLATSLAFTSRFFISLSCLQCMKEYRDSSEIKFCSRDSVTNLGP